MTEHQHAIRHLDSSRRLSTIQGDEPEISVEGAAYRMLPRPQAIDRLGSRRYDLFEVPRCPVMRATICRGLSSGRRLLARRPDQYCSATSPRTAGQQSQPLRRGDRRRHRFRRVFSGCRQPRLRRLRHHHGEALIASNTARRRRRSLHRCRFARRLSSSPFNRRGYRDLRIGVLRHHGAATCPTSSRRHRAATSTAPPQDPQRPARPPL